MRLLLGALALLLLSAHALAQVSGCGGFVELARYCNLALCEAQNTAPCVPGDALGERVDLMLIGCVLMAPSRISCEQSSIPVAKSSPPVYRSLALSSSRTLARFRCYAHSPRRPSKEKLDLSQIKLELVSAGGVVKDTLPPPHETSLNISPLCSLPVHSAPTAPPMVTTLFLSTIRYPLSPL